MDLKTLKENHPDLVAEIVQEAQADMQTKVATATAEATKLGAQQERDRIAGVRAQSIPGHEALVAQLEMDGTSTGADAALAIVAAEKLARQQQGAEFLAGGSPPVPPSGDGDGQRAQATMKRSAFNALSPVDRGEVIKSGVKIVD